MKNNLDYQILDAIDASVYWKDLSGKYLGCNKYMAEMSGMSSDQIIGSTDYEMPWKDQASKIRETDLMVINNCKQYDVEERPMISGGFQTVFLSSKSPLFDEDNNVIGVVGVSINITHNKRLEQEFEQAARDIDKNIQLLKLNVLKMLSQ